MKSRTSDILAVLGVVTGVWGAIAATPSILWVAVPLAMFYAGYRCCQIKTVHDLAKEKSGAVLTNEASLYLQEIAWRNGASISSLFSLHPAMPVYIERAVDELIDMRLVHKDDSGILELTPRGRRYVTDHKMVPQIRTPFPR